MKITYLILKLGWGFKKQATHITNRNVWEFYWYNLKNEGSCHIESTKARVGHE